MASGKMKIVADRLAEKEKELEKIQAEIALLRDILAEADGVPRSVATSKRSTRTPIKKHVLDLMKSSGKFGVNAVSIVELAAAKGIELERASVSSLLSRLKADGTAHYVNDKYVLEEFVEKPQSPNHENIHLHPASRSSSFGS